MENTGKIKVLQDKIVKWTETQSWLLDLYIAERIGKGEFKGRYDGLQEDIDEFKREIYELVN